MSPQDVFGRLAAPIAVCLVIGAGWLVRRLVKRPPKLATLGKVVLVCALVGCGVVIGLLVKDSPSPIASVPPPFDPNKPYQVIYQPREMTDTEVGLQSRPYTREWNEQRRQKLAQDIERARVEQERADAEFHREMMLEEMREANRIGRDIEFNQRMEQLKRAR